MTFECGFNTGINFVMPIADDLRADLEIFGRHMKETDSCSGWGIHGLERAG